MMQLKISGTCIILTATKEIWEVVKQTYSTVQNVAQVYKTKGQNLLYKARFFILIEYHNVIKGLWFELDY